jgi:hypothetical protein
MGHSFHQGRNVIINDIPANAIVQAGQGRYPTDFLDYEKIWRKNRDKWLICWPITGN